MVGDMIPKQLKGLRFNRVRFKEKRAFETGWQNKPYTYDEIHKYFPKENYGVICGEDIRVLDDDTDDSSLIRLYLTNFGETFRVRDHLYFKFDNGYKDKIILNHQTRFFKDSNGKDTHHMGEIQGDKTYVVGANSTHPSGEVYDVRKDIEIKTISYDKFLKVFGDYMKKVRKEIVREHKQTDFAGDDITNIPIGNIISFNGLQPQGEGRYQGEHPLHGSSGGMNFSVDSNTNTWYCFRCCSGGGASELIGVMEGVIQCHEAGSHCYTSYQAKEVISLAREKYGLQIPDNTDKRQSAIARVIKITDLAKKNNFEHCPLCDNKFSLDEYQGYYYCDTCKYGGGIYKFADLIDMYGDKK